MEDLEMLKETPFARLLDRCHICGRLLTLLSFALFALALCMAQRVGAITINEFTVPSAASFPVGITSGSDGNLWFIESNVNNIGRITPAGGTTEFPIPSSIPVITVPASIALASSFGITTGPDGNLWFTENNANNIGQITPAGVITEFPIPTAVSGPFGITAGPDGNLWFTEFVGNKIGRITTAGAITEFTISTADSGPNGITAGPDGNLWFSELGGNKIGRITTAGVMSEFTLPAAFSFPNGITTGPDGNLWFAETNANKIGRIMPAGGITEFTLPTAFSFPDGIITGPDGNLWFTEGIGNKIGQITPAGVITEFPIPTADSVPVGITVGPDGNLWFTEGIGNKIGQAVVNATTMPTPSGQQFFVIEPPVVTPVINVVPSQADPIGIGPIAVGGSIVNMLIGLGQFSASVDVYLAIAAPAIDPFNIHILTPAGFQTVAKAGLVPWVSNTIGNIYVPLFENLPISDLPSGTYTVYFAVTPTGSISTYYIWQTRFIL
jgi:streptogramin lyase